MGCAKISIAEIGSFRSVEMKCANISIGAFPSVSECCARGQAKPELATIARTISQSPETAFL